MSDEWLEVIADSCKCIEDLRFNRCEKITDNGTLWLVFTKKLHSLKLINYFQELEPWL